MEYVTDIRYLVRNSYPTADAVTLDTIGLRHFLKGIGDQQMVLAVGMKNPQSIEEACEILEMYKSLKEEPFGKPSTGAVRMKVVKSANGEAEFLKRETFEVFKHEIKDSMDKKFSEITSMLKSRIGENQRYQAPTAPSREETCQQWSASSVMKLGTMLPIAQLGRLTVQMAGLPRSRKTRRDQVKRPCLGPGMC